MTPPRTKLRRMTPAQFRVIALLWHDAMAYRSIARRLNLSVRTVRKHVEDVGAFLPGEGPSVWRVLRYAEDLLEMGFDDDATAAPAVDITAA